MRVDLLERMANLLETNANNPQGVKFDLGTWGQVNFEGIFQEDSPIPLDCGTTACAFGLAAISGAFKPEGLNYRINPNSTIDVILKRPSGDSYHGFEAAMKLFEIAPGEAYVLFDPSFYERGPSKSKEGELRVAKRIRKSIAYGVIREY